MKRARVIGAPDRVAAAAELITDTRKDFKPSEFDYFQSYFSAGQALFNVNMVQALKYLEEARSLFKEHHHQYKDMFTTDFGQHFLNVLSTMRGIYIGMENDAGFIAVLESEKDFIRSLSAATNLNYYLLLGEIYTTNNRLDKAESALADAKSLLDSNVRLTAPPVATDKQSLKAYETFEKTMRQNAMNQYHFGISNVAAKRGNTSQADSIRDQAGRDAEELRSAVISERVQRKIERKSRGINDLFTGLYGVPLDSVMNSLAKKFSDKRETEPLPEKEPAGYLDQISYYIRKKDHAKTRQLLKESRAMIKDYERRPWDSLITAPYYEMVNNLEAIFHVSQGSYSQMVRTRARPLNTLELTLRDALPYLSEKELQAFFGKYQSSLSQYLAALSFSDSSEDIVKIFEKSAATRGLLLAVSKQRGAIAHHSAMNPASPDILRLNRVRERANVFSQRAHLSGSGADIDSLRFYENEVTALQRMLNERLGINTNVTQTVTWKQVQSKLSPGECFVFIQPLIREYFDPAFSDGIRLNSEYWLILFDNESPSPSLLKIGDEAQLKRAFGYYQNAIKSMLADDVSYDFLWKPIGEVTAGYRRIYFSADGLYHLLNPYTLYNPESRQYLLDEKEIVRVSHVPTFLENHGGSVPASKQLVFIGNPDFSLTRRGEGSRKTRPVEADFTSQDTLRRSGLSQLPGAEQEVKDVARKADKLGMEVLLLTGGKATEANVKQIDRPGVFHFATHGLFETGDAYDAFLRSKLVLAGVNDGDTFSAEDHSRFEDGWLTAYEVTQLRLENTKLVVLSACQTAVGDLKASDGVYGLQRAFEVAGARCVLGSLWKIDDQATASLMRAFYDGFLTSGNVHASYREAMFATRKEFPHPNYWGSFVLNGME